jgi:hypothetical protein
MRLFPLSDAYSVRFIPALPPLDQRAQPYFVSERTPHHRDLGDNVFVCIVSPWIPDGNIIQYTQMNPSADRLLLVRARQLKARRG